MRTIRRVFLKVIENATKGIFLVIIREMSDPLTFSLIQVS